jgi:hypothetical protein
MPHSGQLVWLTMKGSREKLSPSHQMPVEISFPLSGHLTRISLMMSLALDYPSASNMTAATQRQSEITRVLMKRENHIVVDTPTVLLKGLPMPTLAAPRITPKNPARARDPTVATITCRFLSVEGAQGIHDVVEPDRPPAIGRATESWC